MRKVRLELPQPNSQLILWAFAWANPQQRRVDLGVPRGRGNNSMVNPNTETGTSLQVRTRDGRLRAIEPSRISRAIEKAFRAARDIPNLQPTDPDLKHSIEEITRDVVAELAIRESNQNIVHVESILDLIEIQLMRHRFFTEARLAILYRENRNKQRILQYSEYKTAFSTIRVVAKRSTNAPKIDRSTLRKALEIAGYEIVIDLTIEHEEYSDDEYLDRATHRMHAELEKDLEGKSDNLFCATQKLKGSLRRDDATFGHACDEFTNSARGVAEVILRERIARSFANTVSDEGASLETLKEKIDHARSVRNWLGEWSFAIKDPASEKPVQLTAHKSAAKNGSYRLTPLQRGNPATRTAKWERVCEAVISPKLIDLNKAEYGRGGTPSELSR